jgi:translation initiation factor 5A
MVLKIINATDTKVGTNITLEGEVYTVKKIDISKTGKHGHAKARIEAVGIISGNKKVFVVPGHERLEVPMIEKRKGQVLSVLENKASVMDMENFETIEIDIPEELKGQVNGNDNIEYWNIEGTLIIKRKL